jgi:Tfp pilus assembly protein PilF
LLPLTLLSDTTYGVIIDPSKGSYEQKYPISRAIPPGDVERFHIMVGASMSCYLQIRFKFFIDEATVIESGIFDIHIWNPRKSGWHHEYTDDFSRVKKGDVSLFPLTSGQGSMQQVERALPDMAANLSNLAILYSDQGKYAEAERMYQRALRIREQRLGPEHLQMADLLSNLAALYFDQGRYAEAEPLGTRALHIRERQLGSEHPDVAHALNNLAEVYRDQGKYAEAEQMYKRALHIQEQQSRPEYFWVASSLDGLATLYQKQGKYAEAEPLYLRALTILEPEYPYQASFVLNNLADLYSHQEKYIDAESLYQRALCISEQEVGRDHPHTQSICKDYAFLLRTLGRDEEASKLVN